MRVHLTEDSLEVLFAPWEKALGLLGNIIVPRADMSRRQGCAGARARGDERRDEGRSAPALALLRRPHDPPRPGFAVRRGVPALSFAVRNHDRLRHVLVSTPEAEALARRLQAS